VHKEVRRSFGEYHRVPVNALAQLFSSLKDDGRVIVGDIHTHPSGWVGLSNLDKRNPIEYRLGLYAVVLPSFAIGDPCLRASGVHQYLGQAGWQTFSPEEKENIFEFTSQ
jgi:hypothetical protein